MNDRSRVNEPYIGCPLHFCYSFCSVWHITLRLGQKKNNTLESNDQVLVNGYFDGRPKNTNMHIGGKGPFREMTSDKEAAPNGERYKKNYIQLTPVFKIGAGP